VLKRQPRDSPQRRPAHRAPLEGGKYAERIEVVGGAPAMFSIPIHELDALWPFTRNSRRMTVTLCSV
jgi:hypothetical protein